MEHKKLIGLIWIPSDNSIDILCASGFPIRIRRTRSDPPFIVESENHRPNFPAHDLRAAKDLAVSIAMEMIEFEPDLLSNPRSETVKEE